MKLSRIISKLLLSISLLTIYNNCFAQSNKEIIGNPKNAQVKVAMCIGCHSIADYKASFPLVYSVPLLGGQNAEYIINALKSYQSGDRKHPTMQGIAKSLTEQDIADLAAYYSQQTVNSINNIK